MSTDPFSDILRLVEPTSVVSGGFAAGGTWALRFPAPHQIVFSAIASGACWLRVDGQRAAVRLEAGDVGLLPGRRAFTLASDLRATPIDVALRDRSAASETIGDGSGCVVIAGRVALDPARAALLLDALPERILVRAASPHAAPLRWILQQLVAERTSSLPGSDIASAQLAQLLFTQLLRAHVADAPALPAGWLRATGDARIGPALRLVHDEPGRAWRVEELAKASGMSRTRFAVHFRAVAGTTPLGYLTAWPMRLAQRRLREEQISIAALAATLGYASESAFSTAFKRVIGVAPRHYQRAAAVAGACTEEIAREERGLRAAGRRAR